MRRPASADVIRRGSGHETVELLQGQFEPSGSPAPRPRPLRRPGSADLSRESALTELLVGQTAPPSDLPLEGRPARRSCGFRDRARNCGREAEELLSCQVAPPSSLPHEGRPARRSGSARELHRHDGHLTEELLGSQVAPPSHIPAERLQAGVRRDWLWPASQGPATEERRGAVRSASTTSLEVAAPP